jgi:hypothetical protein
LPQPATSSPRLAMPAVGAAKAFWPTELEQIVAAGLLCSESMFKFEQGPGIPLCHRIIL